MDESVVNPNPDQLAVEGAVATADAVESTHEWTQMYDPDTQSYYYYNTSSEEVMALVMTVATPKMILIASDDKRMIRYSIDIDDT